MSSYSEAVQQSNRLQKERMQSAKEQQRRNNMTSSPTTNSLASSLNNRDTTAGSSSPSPGRLPLGNRHEQPYSQNQHNHNQQQQQPQQQQKPLQRPSSRYEYSGPTPTASSSSSPITSALNNNNNNNNNTTTSSPPRNRTSSSCSSSPATSGIGGGVQMAMFSPLEISPRNNQQQQQKEEEEEKLQKATRQSNSPKGLVGTTLLEGEGGVGGKNSKTPLGLQRKTSSAARHKHHRELQEQHQRGESGANGSALQRLQENYHVDFNDVIGEGAYGTVVKGRVRGATQLVAIKSLNKQKVSSRNVMETLGEVETMTLLDHEYIVKLLDVFQDDVNVFIVMEFIGGGSLDSFVADHGPLPEPSVKRIALNLLLALEHIHDKGMVHRDLKLQNCLVSSIDYRPPENLKEAIASRDRRARSRSQIQSYSFRGTQQQQQQQQDLGDDPASNTISPSGSPRLLSSSGNSATGAPPGGGVTSGLASYNVTPTTSGLPLAPSSHANNNNNNNNILTSPLTPSLVSLKSPQEQSIVGDPIIGCKICDFGFCIMVGTGNCLTTYCGTPSFMAPELQQLSENSAIRPYGKPVDIWALGAMLYYLACGKMPFSRSQLHECTPESLRVRFDEPEWKKFSRESKEFISKLLTFDDHHRITTKTAVTHKWVLSAADTAERDEKRGALLETLEYTAEHEGDAAAYKALLAATRTPNQRKCRSLRSAALAVIAAHRLVFYAHIKKLIRHGCSNELITAVNKGLMSFFLRQSYDPPSRAIRARKLLTVRNKSPVRKAANSSSSSSSSATSSAAAAAAAAASENSSRIRSPPSRTNATNAENNSSSSSSSSGTTGNAADDAANSSFSLNACDFVCSLLESAPKVTHFDVAENGIESLDAVQRIVKAAQHHRSLVEVSLAENPLHSLAGRTLLRFARTGPPSLAKVDVHGCSNLANDIQPAIQSAIKERAQSAPPPSTTNSSANAVSILRLGSATTANHHQSKDSASSSNNTSDEYTSSAFGSHGSNTTSSSSFLTGSSSSSASGASSGLMSATALRGLGRARRSSDAHSIARGPSEWSLEYSIMRHLRAANPSRGIFAETISSANRRAATTPHSMLFDSLPPLATTSSAATPNNNNNNNNNNNSSNNPNPSSPAMTSPTMASLSPSLPNYNNSGKPSFATSTPSSPMGNSVLYNYNNSSSNNSSNNNSASSFNRPSSQQQQNYHGSDSLFASSSSSPVTSPTNASLLPSRSGGNQQQQQQQQNNSLRPHALTPLTTTNTGIRNTSSSNNRVETMSPPNLNSTQPASSSATQQQQQPTTGANGVATRSVRNNHNILRSPLAGSALGRGVRAASLPSNERLLAPTVASRAAAQSRLMTRPASSNRH